MQCVRCDVEMLSDDNGVFMINSINNNIGYVKVPVSNNKTSANPIKAFIQGIADGPESESFKIKFRCCPKCRMVEMYY